MWAFVRKFGFFVLLAAVLLFGFQNLEALSRTVRFEFSFFAPELTFVTPEFPVVFLLVAFFLLGMIAAGFQGFYEKLARSLDIRRRDRRIRDLEREVAELHTQLEALAPSPPAEEGERGAPARPAGHLLEESPTL